MDLAINCIPPVTVFIDKLVDNLMMPVSHLVIFASNSPSNFALVIFFVFLSTEIFNVRLLDLISEQFCDL